jgi:hypothetical protein
MRIANLLWLLATSAQLGAQEISRSAARADLDALDAKIRTHSAYRMVNGYPIQAHLDSLRANLPASQTLDAFWRSVQTLIGRLQDAHSNVRLPTGARATLAAGELPFALTSVGDTAIALAPCRCALFLPGYPRLISINGVAVDSLMRISGIRFAGHSRQRYRLRALAALTPIEDVLTRGRAAANGQLAVRLGGSGRDTTIRIATVPKRAAPPPAPESSEVVDGVAILRVPQMVDPDDRRYKHLRAAMESAPFRASRAFIIDVRGNDGGTRHILEYLAPQFIRAPLVYNIAVARADTNGIGDRSLFTPEQLQSESARAALRTTLASFKPTWDYTVDRFVPERFGAVLMPGPASRSLAGRPVVVLMDEGCFSATDIFLGAMRLIPNVTLMGVTSGGGSGRSRDFVLPNSKLTVVLSTMASFQPNGQLYDGVGIPPTITVPRSIADLAVGRDTQLEAAKAFLRTR